MNVNHQKGGFPAVVRQRVVANRGIGACLWLGFLSDALRNYTRLHERATAARVGPIKQPDT